MLYATEKAPFVRRLAPLAVFVLWCVAPGGALQIPAAAAEQRQETAGQVDAPASGEPLIEPKAVIPPGREDLLAEMLGRGITLPGECTFTSGQVQHDSVTATYACPTGAVALTLQHPTKAASGAILTEQFAIAVQSGSPPVALTDDLASRIRSREAAFEWTWLKPTPIPQSSNMSVVIIALLLAAGALWLVLRRRT